MKRLFGVTMVCLAACGPDLEGAPEESAVLEQAVTTAPACAAAVVSTVLAPATTAAQEVKLTCSLSLSATDVVTKRLVLEGAAASGVVIDCHGGKVGPSPYRGLANLFIRSKKNADGTWSRPEGVTIRNCTVTGAVRIAGMGNNGQAEEVRLSSQSLGHTSRAQTAAPRGVLLEKVKLIGEGPIPLYLAPGVTETTLRDSEVAGTSSGTGLYLDAESARNTLRRNVIRVATGGREQVAIDGSAENLVIDNYFSNLSSGGVFLYRNCGEGKTVRHQTPHHNRIINNYFMYKHTGADPAIDVGSRNESFSWFFGYCGDDEPSSGAYPFGSSRSNRDHADENVVAQNQVQAPGVVADLIKVTGGAVNASMNLLPTGPDVANTQVTARLTRKAGCVVEWGNSVGFVANGAVVDGQTCRGETLWTTPKAVELFRYYKGGVGHDASTKGAPKYQGFPYTKEYSLGFLSSRPRSTGTWARAVVCENDGDDTDRYVSLSGSCEEAGFIRDVLGYVPVTLPAPVPALRDVRRCYLAGAGDHFLSTSTSCEGQSVAENAVLFRSFVAAP